MNHSNRVLEKRLAELKKEATRRDFNRYAFRLSSVSELPPDLQAPSLAGRVGGEATKNIIVFPPQIQRGWYYVPKQALVFTTTGMIHLLVSIWPDEEPQVTCIDGCNLLYLKVSLLLLYGYLEIVAQSQESATRLGMEFNTVSWHAISAPLRQFLNLSKTTFSVPADQVAYSPNTRQAFDELPFKFSNGVNLYGLLPGEEWEDLVFQEGVRKPRLYFLQSSMTADTLLMLTTNYLVLIQEDLIVKHGWIVSYIPRNMSGGIQSQCHGLWNELSVQPKRKRQYQTASYKFLLSKQAVEA
jgi:hypothetical protein